MRLYARDEEQGKYYRLNVSPAWAQRHDNGALISCGLSVPKDVSRRSIQTLLRRKQAIEVSHAAWNHSGCQSACILRGDAACRW